MKYLFTHEGKRLYVEVTVQPAYNSIVNKDDIKSAARKIANLLEEIDPLLTGYEYMEGLDPEY